MFGGSSATGQLLQTIEQISLGDGEIFKTDLTLITGAAKFDLHMLNVPVDSMTEGN